MRFFYFWIDKVGLRAMERPPSTASVAHTRMGVVVRVGGGGARAGWRRTVRPFSRSWLHIHRQRLPARSGVG